MTKHESPTTHGGTRKGAGAKLKSPEDGNRVKVSLMVNPTILQSIRDEAKDTGKSLSDVLNQRLS